MDKLSLCKFGEGECYGVKELNLLLKLSNMLSNKEVNLDDVIKLLCEHLHAERIILTVLNRESSNIFIEGSYGITEDDKKTHIIRCTSFVN